MIFTQKVLNVIKAGFHRSRLTLFDLDPKVKVTQNVAQYPRLYVTYAPAKCDVATSHG